VSVRREEACDTCEGNGRKKGAKKSDCAQCGGQGVVLQVMQTPLGTMQSQSVCPSCQGSGVDPNSLCAECRGTGTRPETKEVTVKFPAGCNTGNQLRVRGEGDKGQKGGPPGDLYISVKVRDSTDFQREGFDIYTEGSISCFDAILGTTLEVRTVDGTSEIKVPAGIQPGTQMRLKGRGVPKLGKSDRGDHYVQVQVEVPRNLNTDQLEKVKTLRGGS